MPYSSVAPVASHAKPVTERGFSKIPNAVMLEDLKPGAKLLYEYLAHYSWRNGGGAIDPPLSEISRDLRMSENTIRAHRRVLQQAKLLDTKRRGWQQTNVYTVLAPQAPSADSELQRNAKAADHETQKLRINARARSSAGNKTYVQDTHTGVSLVASLNSRLPNTVNRQLVTDAEAGLVAEIIREWNTRTGQEHDPGVFARRIIRWVREYPDFSADDHTYLIGITLAGDTWWGDAAPSPDVLYGGAQFPKAVATARKQRPESWMDRLMREAEQRDRERAAAEAADPRCPNAGRTERSNA
jgi:hypothetical protein